MSQALTISYDIHPPPSTSAPNLTPTKSQEVPVKWDGTGRDKGYYESLRKSIAEARTILGEELTAWRDAIGNGEQTKESKKSTKDDDDEDVDE
jgi:hypothetical protein